MATSTAKCPATSETPPRPSPEKYAEIAESMGMSAECVTESKNLAKQMSTSTSALVVTPIGGGATTVNTDENSHDLGMTAKGCGKVSLTVNTINESEKQMTCNMNTTLTEQSGGATSTNSLEIHTVRYNDEKSARITATMESMYKKLGDLQMAMIVGVQMPVIPPGSNEYVVEAITALHNGRMGLLERSYNQMASSYNKYCLLYTSPSPRD